MSDKIDFTTMTYYFNSTTGQPYATADRLAESWTVTKSGMYAVFGTVVGGSPNNNLYAKIMKNGVSQCIAYSSTSTGDAWTTTPIVGMIQADEGDVIGLSVNASNAVATSSNNRTSLLIFRIG